MKCNTTIAASLRKLITATILALFGAVCPTQGANNLLVDPSFETNALSGFTSPSGNGYQMVLDNDIEGVWGSENASITTANSGVTPYNATKMLKVANAGVNQTVQITNVSSLFSQIDLGTAVYDLHARFTAGPRVAGTRGQVIISCYNAAGIDSHNLSANRIGYYSTAVYLDSNAGSWQVIKNIGLVPSGTRYVISELVYRGEGNFGGTFIDQASLTICGCTTPKIPTINLSATSSTISEGGIAATIEGQLSTKAATDIVVRYTLGGTAKINTDYTGPSTERYVVIRKGMSTFQIRFRGLGDFLQEPFETIVFQLSKNDG